MRVGEPRRHAAAVQREIGDAGSLHQIIVTPLASHTDGL